MYHLWYLAKTRVKSQSIAFRPRVQVSVQRYNVCILVIAPVFLLEFFDCVEDNT